jgi:cobalt-zinc-cadmium efflux system membrane fusion protein
MTSHEHDPHVRRDGAESSPPAPTPPSIPRPRRRLARTVAAILIVALPAAGGAAAWKLGLVGAAAPPKPTAPRAEAARPAERRVAPDGTAALAVAEQRALGITVVPVRPQTEPIHLPMVGTTRHDEEALTRVRVMFQARVDRVHVRTGQAVRRGEPLLDVYSTVLADAKSEFEIREIEWEYYSRLAATREALRREGSISEQAYLETRNEERRKRRELDVARDKLLIFGLTENEIDGIDAETGPQKARLTIRAPADGVVVERDVVPGNIYDVDDSLLVVTPIDRLWVVGSVFESDLNLVHLGQSWTIRFPFSPQTPVGRVEYVSQRVDPSSRAVRIRTSIPNPDGTLRAGMLVSGSLEIEGRADRTVVPRSALVVAGDRRYVFVRCADERFARREVEVAHETASEAVLAAGTAPGEEAVVTGALMLAQLFEDDRICSARPGVPAAETAFVGPPTADADRRFARHP